jgi:hypothetical protein
MKEIKRGQQFQITRKTPFNKKITEVVTVVGVFANTVIMDNGREYHKIQLQ